MGARRVDDQVAMRYQGNGVLTLPSVITVFSLCTKTAKIKFPAVFGYVIHGTNF